jgi:anti-sigma B factor antagonist
MSTVEYQIEKRANHLAIIKILGRLDANTATSLKERLKSSVEDGLHRLVLDLTAVSLIDSSGLSALVAGFRAVREVNGLLVLAQVGQQAKVALELTHLDQIFPIYEDVDSALAALEQPGAN